MTTEAAQPLDAAAQDAAQTAPTAPLAVDRIHINTDALTIDDMVFLEEIDAGDRKTFKELREFFNRVVVGEDGQPADVGKRSKKQVSTILIAIYDALIADANPQRKVNGVMLPLRARVYSHLETGTPQPAEQRELILCRDVYHCTPVELKRVPLTTILQHLNVMRGEADYREENEK